MLQDKTAHDSTQIDMTWLFFAEAALHRPLWWSSACSEPAMQWRLYTSTSLTTKRWQCWGSAGYCKVPKLLLRGLYLSLPVISGLWGKTSTSVSVVVLDLGADFALACDLQMQKGECGSSEHNPQTHGKVSPPALSTHRPVRTALRSSMPPQRRCSWRRRSTSFLIPSSPMQPSLGNSQNISKELLLFTINNNEPQKTVDGSEAIKSSQHSGWCPAVWPRADGKSVNLQLHVSPQQTDIFMLMFHYLKSVPSRIATLSSSFLGRIRTPMHVSSVYICGSSMWKFRNPPTFRKNKLLTRPMHVGVYFSVNELRLMNLTLQQSCYWDRHHCILPLRRLVCLVPTCQKRTRP